MQIIMKHLNPQCLSLFPEKHEEKVSTTKNVVGECIGFYISLSTSPLQYLENRLHFEISKPYDREQFSYHVTMLPNTIMS